PPRRGERAWYPQISATRPSETASASGSRAHRLSAGQLPNAIARHPAAVGSPHGNCEGKDQVIVLAGSGIEGQMAGNVDFNPKILQFADQGFGFREFAQDLEPAFVQQGLQSRNERQLRHTADWSVAGLGCTGCDQHAQRRNARIDEHVEDGAPNPGEVDHQLGSGRQLVEQPSDMGDDAGVGGTERHALEVSDLEDRWGECHGNFAKSLTSANSIISDEKAELSASINSPSNS